jgi:hypothetical protein
MWLSRAEGQAHSSEKAWRETVKMRQPFDWKSLTVAWPMPRLAPVSNM